MFVRHCQGCLNGRNVGRNWRHMTTASTAAQGIMGSSGCDENKIKNSTIGKKCSIQHA